MKNKQGNPVWNFFASVKLALFTLFTLAVASIIGTIVPQNEEPFRYVELYGPNVAKVFEMLQIPDMYSSWWFVGLLCLFSLNLTVCTIERFPHIWKIITRDNLARTASDRLRKMTGRRMYESPLAPAEAESAVAAALADSGWKADKAAKEDGAMFFSQKGAWTRLGVIIVHVSILVIFVGALIGEFYGYKASVMIPEGSYTDKVYLSNKEHTPVPLGFKVRCDAFYLTYYDTGMPKEYRSDLVVERNGKEVFERIIVVNEPMKYAGLTFYQSSYQAIDGQFSIKLNNANTGAEQKFIIMPRQENRWQQENITFGIVDIDGPDWRGQYRYKIWFSDGRGTPSQFWVGEGQTVAVKRPAATYNMTVKTRFATGLQVVKDPGVWTVYTGCIMMIVGLIIIFFMSHRRVWAFVAARDNGSEIIVCGVSNKNKIGFEKDMAELCERFEEDETLQLKK